MILVDTSVWINHLRDSDQNLVRLLNESRVLCQPFVRGLLALGYLRQREEILTALDNLPQAIFLLQMKSIILLRSIVYMAEALG